MPQTVLRLTVTLVLVARLVYTYPTAVDPDQVLRWVADRLDALEVLDARKVGELDSTLKLLDLRMASIEHHLTRLETKFDLRIERLEEVSISGSIKQEASDQLIRTQVEGIPRNVAADMAEQLETLNANIQDNVVELSDRIDSVHDDVSLFRGEVSSGITDIKQMMRAETERSEAALAAALAAADAAQQAALVCSSSPSENAANQLSKELVIGPRNTETEQPQREEGWVRAAVTQDTGQPADSGQTGSDATGTSDLIDIQLGGQDLVAYVHQLMKTVSQQWDHTKRHVTAELKRLEDSVQTEFGDHSLDLATLASSLRRRLGELRDLTRATSDTISAIQSSLLTMQSLLDRSGLDDVSAIFNRILEILEKIATLIEDSILDCDSDREFPDGGRYGPLSQQTAEYDNLAAVTNDGFSKLQLQMSILGEELREVRITDEEQQSELSRTVVDLFHTISQQLQEIRDRLPDQTTSS